MIPFWCLMPKREKLRPKQMDQLPLVNFENNRVRTFDLSKILLLQNWSLMGENFLLWEKGEFLVLDQFFHWNISWFAQTSVFDLEIRKKDLIYKNKPSGGKEWSKYVKTCAKTIWSSIALMLHFFCGFLLCWHKSPKRGRLKGKCALGPFL
jgi:hypothetical protein